MVGQRCNRKLINLFIKFLLNKGTCVTNVYLTIRTSQIEPSTYRRDFFTSSGCVRRNCYLLWLPPLAATCGCYFCLLPLATTFSAANFGCYLWLPPFLLPLLVAIFGYHSWLPSLAAIFGCHLWLPSLAVTLAVTFHCHLYWLLLFNFA